MNTDSEVQAPKGARMNHHRGYPIDGSKVRFWSTKSQATAGAKAIGWTAKELVPVYTRFCYGWALWVWQDSRCLSREEYRQMHESRQVVIKEASP